MCARISSRICWKLFEHIFFVCAPWVVDLLLLLLQSSGSSSNPDSAKNGVNRSAGGVHSCVHWAVSHHILHHNGFGGGGLLLDCSHTRTSAGEVRARRCETRTSADRSGDSRGAAAVWRQRSHQASPHGHQVSYLRCLAVQVRFSFLFFSANPNFFLSFLLFDHSGCFLLVGPAIFMSTGNQLLHSSGREEDLCQIESFVTKFLGPLEWIPIHLVVEVRWFSCH